MREVRYREDEFELRCARCLEWWPLAIEFWSPAHTMTRCKACLNEAKRIAYARDPERKREACRAYRASQPGIVHSIKYDRELQRRRADPAYDAAYRARRAQAQRRYRERQKVAA